MKTKNNQNRANYIYQFTGSIIKKRLAQASPQSKYAGQDYYVLTILQKDQTRKSLQVFPTKLAQPSIWTTLEQGHCFGKKYLFLCRNQKGYYYLVNWEELPSNGTPKPAKNHDHDQN